MNDNEMRELAPSELEFVTGGMANPPPTDPGVPTGYIKGPGGILIPLYSATGQ